MKEICQVQPNETKDFGEDVCREDIKRYAEYVWLNQFILIRSRIPEEILE